MKQFIKKEELQLINGGYLSNLEGNPVHNSEFVYLQERAHYIATFAELAKGKDFKGKKADSIYDLKREVVDKLLKTQKVEFISSSKAPVQKLTEQLKSEAMAFLTFKEGDSKTDKINNFMQEFIYLKEFEEFGLFFGDDIVKLNKIYTVEEVLESLKSCINLLD